MKNSERDELLGRQVAAQEATANATARLERTLGYVHEEAREEHERRLRAPFPPLRRPFRGKGGVRLLAEAIPSYAALWERSVPEGYLAPATDIASIEGREVVACPCGAYAVLRLFEPVECPGGCRRWFLELEGGVRVHAFPAEEEVGG